MCAAARRRSGDSGERLSALVAPVRSRCVVFWVLSVRRGFSEAGGMSLPLAPRFMGADPCSGTIPLSGLSLYSGMHIPGYGQD